MQQTPWRNPGPAAVLDLDGLLIVNVVDVVVGVIVLLLLLFLFLLAFVVQ